MYLHMPMQILVVVEIRYEFLVIDLAMRELAACSLHYAIVMSLILLHLCVIYGYGLRYRI